MPPTPQAAWAAAYDAYHNGPYDVFPHRVECTLTVHAGYCSYEAYPSAAYDLQGRLWIAYEEGAERWGKDFGAHDTTGVALYQGRAIRIRGFEKDGRTVALPTLPTVCFPAWPVSGSTMRPPS